MKSSKYTTMSRPRLPAVDGCPFPQGMKRQLTNLGDLFGCRTSRHDWEGFHTFLQPSLKPMARYFRLSRLRGGLRRGHGSKFRTLLQPLTPQLITSGDTILQEANGKLDFSSQASMSTSIWICSIISIGCLHSRPFSGRA